MDSFIDKLAQKFTAQDVNKNQIYNGQRREIEELKSQIEQYEKLLQEMKLINLKNMESAKKLNELVQDAHNAAADVASAAADASANVASAAADASANVVTAAADAVSAAIDAGVGSGNAEADREYADEIFNRTSDVIHKENIRVYRNVQATVSASLEDQTKAIIEAQENTAKKNSVGFIKVMSVLIFVAVLADIALRVLEILGLL